MTHFLFVLVVICGLWLYSRCCLRAGIRDYDHLDDIVLQYPKDPTAKS